MDDIENIIKKFHPHPLTFFGFYFGGIFFVAAGLFFFKILILMGIFVFILGEVFRRAETFYLLKGGVERGYNLLSTSRKFIEYEKIQNIEVEQSFIENIFGIGTLKFDTSGTDEIELSFYGVKDPYSIEKIIREKMTAR